MNEIHSPNSSNQQLADFIETLKEAISKINKIERIKASDTAIKEDTLNPNGAQKLKDNRMPHYMNCWGFSDLLQATLNDYNISSNIICLEMSREGVFHVALSVIVGNKTYILGWNQDIVILTDEGGYREIFRIHNRNGDTITDIYPLTSTVIETVKSKFAAFCRLRVSHIIEQSKDQVNDLLLHQQLSLQVFLSEKPRNWLDENGLLSDAIDPIPVLDSPGNRSKSGDLVMGTIEKTLMGIPPNTLNQAMRNNIVPRHRISFMEEHGS